MLHAARSRSRFCQSLNLIADTFEDRLIGLQRDIDQCSTVDPRHRRVHRGGLQIQADGHARIGHADDGLEIVMAHQRPGVDHDRAELLDGQKGR